MTQRLKYKKIRFTLKICPSFNYYVVKHEGIFIIYLKDIKTLHKVLKALV
jgi:hypothetical protein